MESRAYSDRSYPHRVVSRHRSLVIGAKFLRRVRITNGRFRIKPWGLIEEPRTAGYVKGFGCRPGEGPLSEPRDGRPARWGDWSSRSFATLDPFVSHP